MSGHQPQRPYGPVYNPHLQPSASPAVNYSMHQYPNQPPVYNGYWQGQTSPNGVSFPPNTNGYAHHINAQTSVSPAFPPQAAPAAYSGYMAMPQYSTAPAPFLSAPPNSTYNFAPHFPRHQVTPNQSSYEPLQNHPTNKQPSTMIPFTDISEAAAPKDISADLEDGELSSGGQAKSSGDSYDKAETSQDRSAPETPHISNTELQGVVGNHDSLRKGNQNSRSQPKSPGNQDESHDRSTVKVTIREQARRILLELHSFNIGFNDIAREAFDIELLRELFIETGLPVPPLEVQNNQHSRAESSTQAPLIQNGDHKNAGGHTDVGLGSNGTSAALMTNHNVSASPVAPNHEDSPTMTSNHTTPATIPQEPLAGKSTTKPASAKSVDRDQYIKRLKAAKIGKTHQSTQIATETLPTPAEAKRDAADAETPPNTTSAEAHINSPSFSAGAQRELSDLETKRKVQTDLALQKMEALKAQKKLHEQPQPVNFIEKEPRPAPLGLEIGDPILPTVAEDLQTVEGPTPADGRQTSYFSPVSRKPAFSIPGLFSAIQEVSSDSQIQLIEPTKSNQSNLAMEGDATDTGIGPRKRLKAADFMDMTPTTVHRSLGNGEDAGVIIDISDDEMESVDDDDFDIHSSNKLPRTSTSTVSRRDQQNLVSGGAADSTTPGRLQEPQELKMKENEIESMNRKILELEQRIKAKQVASRVQSPRPAMSSLSSQAPLPLSKESTISSSQQAESATEEQLVREKENQEDKLATAQAEKLQIVDERGQTTEQSTINAQTSVIGNFHQRLRSSSGLENDENQPDLLPESSRRESSLQQELKLKAEFSAIDLEISSREERLKTRKLNLERLEEEIRHEDLDLEHRRSELQRLNESLQLLQQATEVTESTSAAQEDENKTGEINNVDLERANTERPSVTRDISESILPQLPPTKEAELPLNHPPSIDSQINSRQLDHAVSPESTEPAVNPENTDAKETVPANQVNNAVNSPDGELEEDIMDISGSDVDEGELLETRRQSTSERQDDMDTSDDDDFYEPPSHVGSTQQQPTAHVVENQQQPPFDFEPEPPTSIPLPDLADNQDCEGMVDETTTGPIQLEINLKHTGDHGSVREDGKDEDDYEPPEADNPPKGDDDSIAHSPRLHEPSSDHPAGATVANVQQLTAKSAPEGEHFIPYESPLKQFSSYRFQPSFRNEVPGGYRSLTYSHDIQPDIELCQFELSGGVCNDESCRSQHFQKMMLPDHIILGVMGKPEGSTPEENDDYIKGLRALIIDLREREIKDLDAIAEAIARYRLKFLNDSSAKVLPS